MLSVGQDRPAQDEMMKVWRKDGGCIVQHISYNVYAGKNGVTKETVSTEGKCHVCGNVNDPQPLRYTYML